jgi:hypothetical protein
LESHARRCPSSPPSHPSTVSMVQAFINADTDDDDDDDAVE